MIIIHKQDNCNQRVQLSKLSRPVSDNLDPKSIKSSLPPQKVNLGSKTPELRGFLPVKLKHTSNPIHYMVINASKPSNHDFKIHFSNNYFTKSEVLAVRRLAWKYRFNFMLHIMQNSGDDEKRKQQIRDILQKIKRAVERNHRTLSYFCVFEKPQDVDLHAHVLIKLNPKDVPIIERRVRDDRILRYHEIKVEAGGLMGAVNYITKYRRHLGIGEKAFIRYYKHNKPKYSDGSFKKHRTIPGRDRFSMSTNIKEEFYSIMADQQFKQKENNARFRARQVAEAKS